MLFHPCSPRIHSFRLFRLTINGIPTYMTQARIPLELALIRLILDPLLHLLLLRLAWQV